MAANENPLLKALPPETDYITYLTILEYNLTEDQLPTLHNVLQDTSLTSNIGWDLVHLLLPLLPASEQCLQDVARLGNPREVVLKVTELLEAITHEREQSNEAQEYASDEENGHAGPAAGPGEMSGGSNILENVETTGALLKPAERPQKVSSSPALKFSSLLSMLSVLHPRIKTKYPSRFLSTSLQAILPAYTQIALDELATDAVLSFIKSITGSKRPKLPPRMSSTAIRISEQAESAPDPEAGPEKPGTEDAALQIRLLQSFLTHVIDAYVESLSSINNDSGFAWTSRLQEKLHPEKIIPYRKTFGAMFAETEGHHGRDTTIGQMIALARDLNIHPRELFAVVSHAETEVIRKDDEMPSSPSDIQLSHTGSLYLFAAMQASSILFEAPPVLHFEILPCHLRMLESFIGDVNMEGIGAEKESLVDAVLLLGFAALQEPSLGELGKVEDFNRYLQRLSVLSSNTPSPNLRYHAHILTSMVLHAHPSVHVRLAFIRDTLDQCPYENLKVTAVGWFKDEVLAACTDTRAKDLAGEDAESSFFGSVHALSAIAPFLFIEIPYSSFGPSTFSLQIPFFLTVLNFYYLICTSQPLRERLCVAKVTSRYDILGKFTYPLRELVNKLRQDSDTRELSFTESQQPTMEKADLYLLDEALERVEAAKESLGIPTSDVKGAEHVFR